MRIARFKNTQSEWYIPLPELASDMKRVLRIQWREFVHEVEDAEIQTMSGLEGHLNTITMFERSFKAS